MTCQRPLLSLYSRGLKKLRPAAHPDIGIHSGLKFRMGTPTLSPQGEKMFDLDARFIQKPDDGLGYSRAFCAAIGRLENLDRAARIRVWYAGAYRVCTVGVKIPGNCYWAKLDVPLGKVSKLVVNCANFGGRIHD